MCDFHNIFVDQVICLLLLPNSLLILALIASRAKQAGFWSPSRATSSSQKHATGIGAQTLAPHLIHLGIDTKGTAVRHLLQCSHAKESRGCWHIMSLRHVPSCRLCWHWLTWFLTCRNWSFKASSALNKPSAILAQFSWSSPPCAVLDEQYAADPHVPWPREKCHQSRMPDLLFLRPGRNCQRQKNHKKQGEKA